MPAGVGEDVEGQKSTKDLIDRSIKDSLAGEEDSDWLGADKEISKIRPESILNRQSDEAETLPSYLLEFSDWVVNERVGGEFFARCACDEGGRCLPEEGGLVVPAKELQSAQALARVKAEQAPKPTAAEVDRDISSYEVRGELVRRHVPTLEYTQYLVNGVHVDPVSVRGAPIANSFCSTGQGGGVDPTCSPGGPSRLEQAKSAKVAAGARYREATDKEERLGRLSGRTAKKEHVQAVKELQEAQQANEEAIAELAAARGDGTAVQGQAQRSVPGSDPHGEGRVMSTIKAMQEEGHGIVPLHQLGPKFSGSPAALHAALLGLWKQGKVSLSRLEGRHGNSEEERRWAMPEPGGDGQLGYVSLR